MVLPLMFACVPTPEPAEEGLGEVRDSIVGGTPTDIEAHPWQVFLQSRFGGGSFCGGAILESRWILTAAHCLEGTRTSDIEVVAGVSRQRDARQGQVRRVRQRTIFPGYRDPSFGRDVALLELDRPLDLSTPRARAIAPLSPSEADLAAPGTSAVVTGWGSVRSGGPSPDRLQAVAVPIVSNAEADRAYFDVRITNDMIGAGRLGAGGADSCQGDSGGPLTVAGPNGRRLVGIVSWGYGCGDRRFPGMYARVSAYYDWIRDRVPLPTATPPANPTPSCTAQASTSGLPIDIPDNNPNGVRLEARFPSSGTADTLAIDLDIEHTYRGDLVVTLESPRGEQIVLSNRAGDGADDLRLRGTIPALAGTSLSGTWRLVVQDLAAQDTGAIRGWSLSAETACSTSTGPWRASGQPNLPTANEREVCDTLQVSQDGDAADARLSLNGEHTWRAALRATLRHNNQTLEVFGAGRLPREAGSFSVDAQAIRGFQGAARGPWTLCITDTDAFDDVGVLRSWSVGE